MATMKELCATIPQSVLQMQEDYAHDMMVRKVKREVARRTARSYTKRMEALADDWHIYDKCRQSRPQKGKYKNAASREEAGTQGRITMGVRAGRYTVVVCKSENKFN